jgi:eukaryotic-like serine/threonine-protein kinase
VTAPAPTRDTIFLAAIEIDSPQERASYIARACGGDSKLRGRVEKLVLAHFRAGSFLERPAGGPFGAAAHTPSASETPVPGGRTETQEGPGARIGPYQLLQEIGAGGMGAVFLAVQHEPVQRQVALKLIKPGLDSRQVLARFEAERQALALMDHPNIAHVLDAGTTESGRPYFVMELVTGVTITRYCDERRLTPRERLELFLPVCQAVQHAHQKGIVHRDLKPSNVLVTLYDGQPVPKVIDFGIAKATGPKQADQTMFTQVGQIVGTLEYMSPEQAELNQHDIDTRSDVYALGLLLYELLTGTTPLERKRLKEAPSLEVLRLVRDEEPPRPSTRLSSTEELPAIAAARGLEPKKLSRQVRGELDWIVMKCLEKNRNRRYDTANSLAKDIERYLHDEPVQACPPSAAYRLRKFVRRNRTAVAAAVAAVGLLVLAVLGLTISNLRITQEQALTKKERDEAEANFRKARKAVDDQFRLVSQSTLFEAPGFQSLRKDLLESALKYYQDFLRQRPDDPELQAEVAAAYLRLYQIHEAIDGSYSPDAMGKLEKGIEILEKLLREHPDDAGLYSHLAGFAKGGRSLHAVYSAAGAQAAPFELISLFQRAARIWENYVKNNPTEIGFQIDLSAFYIALQVIQASAGQPAEAVDSVRKALAIREKITRENPKIPEYRAELAHTHEALGRRLRQAGPPDEV